MITTNLEPILEEETGGAKYRVGQPVTFKFGGTPYLIIGARFDTEEWVWMYSLLGVSRQYPETDFKPFYKLRGEMKQLIRRIT